jgi:UDP-N-acetylmuramate dehydrogenase
MPILEYEKNKILAPYSTFGIGGPARLFCTVTTIEQMSEVIIDCRRQGLPFLILGKGSNCLFDDRGFNGCVVLNKICFIEFDYPTVRVGAGYSFSLLGVQTARSGYEGLEFASGIPGSVGGAIYMNAGANGSETEKYLSSVSYVNEEGALEIYQRDQLKFEYRFSQFQQMQGAIVAATFKLEAHTEARKKQLDILSYRKRTQPLSEKSAGCVFRNPSTASAGALIERSGLKGKRIGGAEVSTLHGNFIVNKEGAKAEDVLALTNHVQEVVKEKTGCDLKVEIRIIPYV